MRILFLAVALVAVPHLEAQNRSRPDVWAHLSKTYDKDGDGKVTLAEYGRGESPFKNLDRDGDGAITQADFRSNRRGGNRGSFGGNRGRGAGNRAGGNRARGNRRPAMSRERVANRLGDLFGSFLNQDGKPGIDKAEWKRIVASLNPRDDGLIPRENYNNLFGKAGEERMAAMGARSLPQLLDVDGDGDVTTVDMAALFTMLDADGDGNIEHGSEIILPPGPGEMAPDFTLPFANDKTKTVTLSSFQGKKPVALIFGSYT